MKRVMSGLSSWERKIAVSAVSGINVDGGKERIILQALVTPSEVMDNQPMLDLLWRVRFRWKLRPRQITGDTK